MACSRGSSCTSSCYSDWGLLGRVVRSASVGARLRQLQPLFQHRLRSHLSLWQGRRYGSRCRSWICCVSVRWYQRSNLRNIQSRHTKQIATALTFSGRASHSPLPFSLFVTLRTDNLFLNSKLRLQHLELSLHLCHNRRYILFVCSSLVYRSLPSRSNNLVVTSIAHGAGTNNNTVCCSRP